MFDLNFKKGAMFGKLSQLDHINFFSSKKGAMFGLDARIALAIFGALSVISGAALYSAIQQSKLTALHQDIVEIAKAFEAYYLDVGAELSLTDVANYESAELVKSSKPGWKGPYIGYSIDTTATDPRYINKNLIYPKFGSSILYFSEFSNTNFPAGSVNLCPNELDCSIYISILAKGADNVNSFSSYTANLDEMLDSSDGCQAGVVRCVRNDPSNLFYLYYKIMDKRNWK